VGRERGGTVGWLSSIMVQLMDSLFRLTGSYGAAILLMTLLLRVVLFPLTAASTRSTVKMQGLQAEQKEIQRKYKKDPEQANRATMELFKKHKVNPWMGCLAMLIQLPIILGFIAALRTYEFSGNPGFLWIPHLGQVDPYYVLPVLAAVATYVQSKLTTPATDSSMQMMTYAFPVLVLVMGVRFPAAFTLYWAASSGFAILERYLIVRPQPEQADQPKKT